VTSLEFSLSLQTLVFRLVKKFHDLERRVKRLQSVGGGISRIQEGSDVDTGAIGDDKILVFKTASSKHEYEVKATGSGDMTKAVYDIDDNGTVDNSEKLEASTKAQVQDHTPKVHTLASHSTKDHAELTGVTSDLHHAQVHTLPSHSDVTVASPADKEGLVYESGTSLWKNKQQYVYTTLSFAVTGTLTTGTDKAPTIVAPCTLTIVKVKVVVKTAPTGASIIVDVNKAGTTIFTTQGNRPEIAIGETQDDSGTPDVTALAEGDKVTVDIDQVGSTIAGADLTVEVVCKQNVSV